MPLDELFVANTCATLPVAVSELHSMVKGPFERVHSLNMLHVMGVHGTRIRFRPCLRVVVGLLHYRVLPNV